MNRLITSFFLFLFIVSLGCKTDKKVSAHDLPIKIRLKADPQKINPMVYPVSTAREIYQYIFLSLADFHPDDLSLTPILIEALPKGERITEGKYAGGTKFSMRFLDAAKWSDGTDITAADYLFTVKTANNTSVNAAGWRTYLKEISDVVLYPDDPKKFDVILANDYMVALETVTTINPYPKHIYDPNGVMDSWTLEELKDSDKVSERLKVDSSILAFAKEFNSAKFSRDVVVGSGPYVLDQWEADQYLILKRQENFWGDAYPNNPFLQAFPSSLQFSVVPDEATALTLLKSGELDLVPGMSSSSFDALRKEDESEGDYRFLTPQLIRYYYIGLNNRTAQLSDKNVRKALAYLVDVERIIETLELGIGTRTIGHFNPAKNYYHPTLKPVEHDVTKAKQLLDNSGWKDTNDNGIRDKMIEGVLYELDFDILVSASKLGQRVSLIFQESAKEAGINIELVQKEFRLIRSENIAKRDYDMATLVSTSDAAPVDPYDKWHTDNDVIGKRNETGFGTTESDEIIENLRAETNLDQRNIYYHKLQEIMYDEQPVIFLYCPKEKMALRSSFNGKSSSNRPGYLANTFEYAPVQEFSEN